jgi:hypothetical protein
MKRNRSKSVVPVAGLVPAYPPAFHADSRANSKVEAASPTRGRGILPGICPEILTVEVREDRAGRAAIAIPIRLPSAIALTQTSASVRSLSLRVNPCNPCLKRKVQP